MSWIPFRELMLRVVGTPCLWLPLVALTVYTITCRFTTPWWSRIVPTMTAMLLASGLYSLPCAKPRPCSSTDYKRVLDDGLIDPRPAMPLV